MVLNEAIALYLDWRRAQHLSPTTIRHSRRALANFAGFCQKIGLNDPRTAKLETLLQFYQWVRQRRTTTGKAWSKSYQAKHMWTAKDFFHFLYQQEHLLSDITLNLPQIHKGKPLPRGIMDKEQVTRLLRQPNLSQPAGFRDRTLFEVLYSCGLRGGELCRLTPYDIDLQQRIIRIVQSKGRKDRHVPIGKVAKQYLAAYLKTVRPLLLKEKKSADASASLFLLHPASLRTVFCRHRDTAGLSDTFTVHSLRHTCATEMLRGGASIRHVQELLGHSCITTTQIYTRIVITDLQKAHEKSAPSERRKTDSFIPFNRATAAWRQEKPKRRRKNK
ncbi:MAG: tyrosine-type recombinase/integrase [Puniceicoccaceae bacterium]|nr:tyrosine-type recombinase/integrase [Puniceicoccaceae bacterium]